MSFSKEERGILSKGNWKWTKKYQDYFTKSKS